MIKKITTFLKTNFNYTKIFILVSYIFIFGVTLNTLIIKAQPNEDYNYLLGLIFSVLAIIMIVYLTFFNNKEKDFEAYRRYDGLKFASNFVLYSAATFVSLGALLSGFIISMQLINPVYMIFGLLITGYTIFTTRLVTKYSKYELMSFTLYFIVTQVICAPSLVRNFLSIPLFFVGLFLVMVGLAFSKLSE